MPSATPAVPATLAGSVATAPATAATSTDFMAMLAQLIGPTLTPTTGGAPVPAELSSLLESADPEAGRDDDAAEGLECGGLAALLPMLAAAGDRRSLTMDGLPPATAATTTVTQAVTDLLAAGTKAPPGPGGDMQLLRQATDLVATDAGVDALNAGAANEAAAPSFAAHLSAAEHTAARASAHTEMSAARHLQSPVGTHTWADELGTRMTWMAEQGQQSASLRLSPEHLGPLEIRIAIRDDQASVWFGAAHADTRAAIEHALPRLRELFEAQGLSLADAGVFREPPRDQPATLSGGTAGSESGDANEATAPSVAHVRPGLIDAYA